MKKKLAFLLKVGFPKAVAEQIVKAEDLADDFDSDATGDEVRTALATTFTNDPEFMKGVRTPIIGEVLSGRERHLMKLAKDVITQEEVDALPKEGRFDKMLELAVTKLKAPKEGAGDAAAFETERKKLLGEIETLSGTITEYKEKTIPSLEKKAVDVEHGFHIRGAITAAAMKGDRKLLLAADKTTGLLLDDITAEHDLVWDAAKKTVVIKQKGADMIAHDPKERSKPLTLENLVGSVGEANGYFVLNGGKDKPGGGNGNNGNGGNNADAPKYKVPGLKKAEAHEASLAGGEK